MTLPFFPIPYPDEILYSVFARYHVYSGNNAYKITSRELFGSPTQANLLQINLNQFIKNLPPFYPLTVDDFYQQHTLLPFFSPFLSEEKYINVKNRMEDKSTKGGNAHSKLGLSGSSVQLSHYLYYCPDCFKENISAYGDAYWHRVHQIPGVLYCPKHFKILYRSKMKYTELPVFGYMPCNKETISFIKKGNVSQESEQVLISVSKDVLWLLESKLPSQCNSYYRKRYKLLLGQIGLTSPSGRTYNRKLKSQFLNFYNKEILKLLHADVKEDSINWLDFLLQKHSSMIYPVRHILLIRFLMGNTEKFFNTQVDTELPFGEGPWFCLNPVCENYKKACIFNVKIHYARKSMKTVGCFSCECGFKYKRIGRDTSIKDKHRFDTVISYGDVWERAFITMLSQGAKKTVIMKELQLTYYRLKSEASRLNLIPFLGNNQSFKCIKPQNKEINFYKQEWLKLKSEGLSRSEMRSKEPNLFAKLYRADKKWLSENSPPIIRKNNGKKHSNWNNIDELLFKEVKTIVGNWNDSGKLKRITKNGILKKINKINFYNKHNELLPKTKELLIDCSEDISEFQIRRAKNAIEILNHSNVEIKEYMVYEEANIRYDTSDIVKNFIKEEIKRITF